MFWQVAAQWKVVGALLNIPTGSLEVIQHDNPRALDALLAMFALWKSSKSSPYLWKTVLKVLATDIVGHRRLADDIAHRLSGEIGDCVHTLLHLPLNML